MKEMLRWLHRINPAVAALMFILVYCVLMAPYALEFIIYHSDERHYIDAAMYMLSDGDYLSPVNPDGGFRFLKPVFTYWVVLASYKLFGISEFSARLPFLLAGALTVWMTWKIAISAFNDKRVAWLAMFIFASVPVFNHTVALSITDIWQLFFIQIMTYGVTGVALYPQRRKFFLSALYLGAGFGIMVKGVAPLIFLFVCLAFLLLNPWRRQRLVGLVHIPSMIAGLFIGLFWFVAVYVQHGREAVELFYGDQVGLRLAQRLWQVLRNVSGSLLILLFLIFPFIFVGYRCLFYQESREAVQKHRRLTFIFAFTVVWILALLAVASMVTKFYPRYLLPLSHLLAIAFAYLIVQCENKKGTKKIIGATTYFSGFLFLIVALGAIITLRVFDRNAGIAELLFCAGALGLAGVRSSTIITNSLRISLYMVALFTALSLMMRPFSQPCHGDQITGGLRKINITKVDSVQFYGDTKLASRVRVSSKGAFRFPALKPVENPPTAPYVIVGEADKDMEQFGGYDFQLLSYVWSSYPVGKLLTAGTDGQREKLKLENSKKYFLGVRKNSHGSDAHMTPQTIKPLSVYEKQR